MLEGDLPLYPLDEPGQCRGWFEAAHGCLGLLGGITDKGLRPDTVPAGTVMEIAFEILAAALLLKIVLESRVRIVNTVGFTILGLFVSHPHTHFDEDFRRGHQLSWV